MVGELCCPSIKGAETRRRSRFAQQSRSVASRDLEPKMPACGVLWQRADLFFSHDSTVLPLVALMDLIDLGDHDHRSQVGSRAPQLSYAAPRHLVYIIISS
jgi:hypothetical protein